MVPVAQPDFDGRESAPALLEVLVRDTVQGGGDGGVAVRAGRQGEAEERAADMRPKTGDPGGVQAVEEVPAGTETALAAPGSTSAATVARAMASAWLSVRPCR